jgi:FAD/FMN-containing dehydrogenase
VTAFEFQLHDVGPMVTGGLVVHPFARAREVLRVFRDQAASAPDEMFIVAALGTAPDGSGTKIAAMGAVHSGPLAAGEAATRAIKAFGPPIMDVLGPMPYAASNMMLDAGFPSGARNYWKSHFLPALTDDAIDALAAHFESIPSPMCQIVIEHFHGHGTRVPLTDTAFAIRQEGFNVLVLGQWMDAADDVRGTDWTRRGYAALQPFVGPRRYVNYLGQDDMAGAALEAAYGPNLPRLRTVKAAYDPDNVFRGNVNIVPDVRR